MYRLFCKFYHVAQPERNDWHNSIETGGTVYSETVPSIKRRMQLSIKEVQWQ